MTDGCGWMDRVSVRKDGTNHVAYMHMHMHMCMHMYVCACACACACTPQGEWSDESPLWEAHPDVQRALWPARAATPLAAVRDLREDLGRRRLRPQHRWAGFMVGRMGMRTDGQMVGGRVDGCMDGRMAGRVGGRMYTLWLALHVYVHV